MPKGGARPGAGRKPKPKLPFASKAQAESVLSKLGTEYKGQQLPTRDDLWLRCLLSKNQALSFATLVYLTNREQGRPAQQVIMEHTGEGGGPVVHTIRFGDGHSDSPNK